MNRRSPTPPDATGGPSSRPEIDRRQGPGSKRLGRESDEDLSLRPDSGRKTGPYPKLAKDPLLAQPETRRVGADLTAR